MENAIVFWAKDGSDIITIVGGGAVTSAKLLQIFDTDYIRDRIEAFTKEKVDNTSEEFLSIVDEA